MDWDPCWISWFLFYCCLLTLLFGFISISAKLISNFVFYFFVVIFFLGLACLEEDLDFATLFRV